MTKYLTPDEVAERLGLKKTTLQGMRVRGGGPAYIKTGYRTVRYRPEDVEAWEAQRRFSKTAQERNKSPD